MLRLTTARPPAPLQPPPPLTSRWGLYPGGWWGVGGSAPTRAPAGHAVGASAPSEHVGAGDNSALPRHRPPPPHQWNAHNSMARYRIGPGSSPVVRYDGTARHGMGRLSMRSTCDGTAEGVLHLKAAREGGREAQEGTAGQCREGGCSQDPPAPLGQLRPVARAGSKSYSDLRMRRRGVRQERAARPHVGSERLQRRLGIK